MLQRLALFCLTGVLVYMPLMPSYADTPRTRSAVEIANRQLEATYQQLKNYWPNEDLHRERLINSQRVWRSFRDAECEFVNSSTLPEDHIENYERCVQSMTQARNRALQHYLQCAEANQDCAVAAP